ncbi:MAG: prepilin peptidase [Bacilli bacterium]
MIIIVYMFIIGAVLGSFYMVVGDRLSNNESIVVPRSHCSNCNHILSWYELIPIVSYIIQRGKCKNCHTKLSISYMLIEILSGTLFALSYYLYGFNYEFFMSIIISSLLIIIYVSDFKYLIINDEPLIIAITLSIITNFIFLGTINGLYLIISGLVMFIFMYLVKLFGDKAFKRESLGGGDIKLAFFIGCTLGLRLAFVSLIIASFLALPYASYYVVKKQEREIPFGPFLITGVLITFMLSNQIRFVLDLIMLAA